MEQQNLIEDLIQMAGDLAKRDDLTEDTIVGDVVKDSGEPDGNNTATDFKMGTEFTIKKNGGENKTWPDNWFTLTFKDLASKLIMLLILFCFYFSARSQLQLQIGAAKTDLKQNAIQFSINYLKSLDSIIGGKERTYFGKHSVFAFTPVFDIESGTNDALNGIDAKLTGLLLSFKTKTMASGDIIPDFAKPFSSFPISAGIETNNQFNFINTIVEAGFVPVFIGRDNAEVLRHTKLGLYLQAGYKFKLDTTAALHTGGDQDQSDENLNSNIFRAKGSIQVDTKQLAQIGFLKFGLVGSADVWYDFINSAFYQRIDGAFRIYLSADNSIDLIYQHGSGAPLFNTGNQFGTSLTIKF